MNLPENPPKRCFICGMRENVVIRRVTKRRVVCICGEHLTQAKVKVPRKHPGFTCQTCRTNKAYYQVLGDGGVSLHVCSVCNHAIRHESYVREEEEKRDARRQKGIFTSELHEYPAGSMRYFYFRGADFGQIERRDGSVCYARFRLGSVKTGLMLFYDDPPQVTLLARVFSLLSFETKLRLPAWKAKESK